MSTAVDSESRGAPAPSADPNVGETRSRGPLDTFRRRRLARRVGTALVVLGVVGLAYGATIYFWHDPVTDLYARWKQSQLAAELDDTLQEFRPLQIEAPVETAPGNPEASPERVLPEVDTAEVLRVVSINARRFSRQVELGDAIGRIRVPRLDIHPVFLHGTRWGADLSRGPGHYEQTSYPGLGKVTAIAGHRTTFGAWFRNIDDLRPGDEIRLELPYGNFVYVVRSHKIVDNEDWSIIRPRGYDALVLSACHPLYGASERWVVFAQLARVETPDGVSVAV
jgi:sortase A